MVLLGGRRTEETDRERERERERRAGRCPAINTGADAGGGLLDGLNNDTRHARTTRRYDATLRRCDAATRRCDAATRRYASTLHCNVTTRCCAHLRQHALLHISDGHAGLVHCADLLYAHLPHRLVLVAQAQTNVKFQIESNERISGSRVESTSLSSEGQEACTAPTSCADSRICSAC